jgi:capsular polysaccharide transport system ATP-binding protein
MRSRLQFGLSLAFDFDVYISDEVTAAGDAAFRQKAANAFKSMTSQAGLIMVAHDEGTLGIFARLVSGFMMARHIGSTISKMR